MTSRTVTYCSACGQPVKPPPQLCANCNHPDTSHDIPGEGTIRTRCYRISGPEGKRCPCRRYEPAAVTQ